MNAKEKALKQEYIERMMSGEGFMPWQNQDRSSENEIKEIQYREHIEALKERLLSKKSPLNTLQSLPNRT